MRLERNFVRIPKSSSPYAEPSYYHHPLASLGNEKIASRLLLDEISGGSILKHSQSSLAIKVPNGQKTTTPPKQQPPQQHQTSSATTLAGNGRNPRRRRLPPSDARYYHGYDEDSTIDGSHPHYTTDGSGIRGSSSGYRASSMGEDGEGTSSGARRRSRGRGARYDDGRGYYGTNGDGSEWGGGTAGGGAKTKGKASSRFSKAGMKARGYESDAIPVGQWVVIITVVVGLVLRQWWSSRGDGVKRAVLDGRSEGKKAVGKQQGYQRKKKGGKGGRGKSRPSVNGLKETTTVSPNENKENSNLNPDKTADPPESDNGNDDVTKIKTVEPILKPKKKKKKKKTPIEVTYSNPNPDDATKPPNSLSSKSTPDSVSTDGSSSTHDENNIDDHIIIPTNDHVKLVDNTFDAKQNDEDDTEWTTVGSNVNHRPVDRNYNKPIVTEKSKVKAAAATEKNSVDEPIVKNDKSSHAVMVQPPPDQRLQPVQDELKDENDTPQQPPTSEEKDDVGQLPIPNESEDKKDVTTTPTSDETTTIPPLVVEDDTAPMTPMAPITTSQPSEDDDLALARILQREEEEMAAAAASTTTNRDDCWEEVSSKKKKSRKMSS